jgi:hypothetical protein
MGLTFRVDEFPYFDEEITFPIKWIKVFFQNSKLQFRFLKINLFKNQFEMETESILHSSSTT